MFRGYWHNEKDTRDAFHDGYLNTGADCEHFLPYTHFCSSTIMHSSGMLHLSVCQFARSSWLCYTSMHACTAILRCWQAQQVFLQVIWARGCLWVRAWQASW